MTHQYQIQFRSGFFLVTEGGWIHLIPSAIALTPIGADLVLKHGEVLSEHKQINKDHERYALWVTGLLTP